MRPKVERIAIYIWLITTPINTLSISFFIEGSNVMDLLLLYLTVGTFISLIFSLPALVFMNMAISYCYTWRKSGAFMFRTCLIMAVLCAIFTWWVIELMFQGAFKEIVFPFIAAGSAALATLTQYRNFKRLATYEEHLFETI